MSGIQNNNNNQNDQILNDIQSLQKFEQQLFNNLESSTNLSVEEQQKIIEKINQISNMRINLYKTLSNVNNFFENSLTSSIGTLKEQSVAIGIVESELNRSKKRLEILEAEKNNKIRLIEINNYYGDKYTEHSQLMKIVIFTLIIIIIISFIYNKGFIPIMVYKFLIFIISIIGGVNFMYRYFSIISRDNMNYQEYNWKFDPNNEMSSTTTTVTTSDPWASLNTYGTCIGESCCSPGQTYDSTLNLCVLPTATSTATSAATSASAAAVSKESFISNILTKTQPNKYKDDYNMRPNYEPNKSNSFIYSS